MVLVLSRYAGCLHLLQQRRHLHAQPAGPKHRACSWQREQLESEDADETSKTSLKRVVWLNPML